MSWIFKQAGSDNYWIGYRFNGKQFRASTGTPDKAQAERDLAKVRAMYEARKAGALHEDVYRTLTGTQNQGKDSLKLTTELWLNECNGDVAPKTVERYRDIVTGFCDFLKADDAKPLLKDVQQDNVAEYLRAKRARTSPQTARLARRILSGFFNYATENNKIPANPVPSAKSLKLTRRSAHDTQTRRAFTLRELKTLFDKCPNDFWKYMVLAGFFLGQRLGDLICLTWGAVDFKDKCIRFVQSKTGKTVIVPLHPTLLNFLTDRKKSVGRVSAATPIWPEKAELYRRRGARAFSNEFYDEVLLPCGLVPSRDHKKIKRADTDTRKVNEVSFHCLRHTFVSLLKISGASQSVAKELAGHSSDFMSDIYTHTPEAELTKAIKQLPDIAK